MVDLEMVKELILKINGEKFKTKVPGIHQWSNDGPFSKQIDFTESELPPPTVVGRGFLLRRPRLLPA